jgi:DNA-binding NtrC family response regulator
MLEQRKRTLLIIDDEKTLCDTLTDYLQGNGLSVLSAGTGAEALAICSQKRVDVVLLDQKLPDGEGHALAPAILERNDQTKIIFITAFPSFENAVKAVRTGAHDYLSKPLDLDELKLTVDRMLRTQDLEQVAQVHAFEQERDQARAVIIGSGGGLAGVEQIIMSATRTSAPVLITGETGTGKSLVAKSIHYLSALSKAPFIDINCAALPESLIEAELFGYEKGAFTGAAATKKGLFEMADGGTLLLDEIGELPVHLQTKLLHALEAGEVRRVGGTTPRKVKVRIIAATNADLVNILGKTFRQDLYYRLNVIQIHLPPLRERKQDLPALCEHLLRTITPGKKLRLVDGEIARLQHYAWPGNVRELRNVLERAALVNPEGEVCPSLLIGNRRDQTYAPGRQDLRGPQHTEFSLPEGATLADIEERAIKDALQKHSGNLTHTAQALGISLSTLKRRLKEFRSQ